MILTVAASRMVKKHWGQALQSVVTVENVARC